MPERMYGPAEAKNKNKPEGIGFIPIRPFPLLQFGLPLSSLCVH